VCALAPEPKVEQLAAAGIELRQRYPHLLLLVAGPPRLISGFARRYPALVDMELPTASAEAVLNALDTPTSNNEPHTLSPTPKSL